MTEKPYRQAYLLPIIGIFLFCFTSQLHNNILPVFLSHKGVSQTEIEHIEILQMLGYVVASFVLMIVTSVYSYKRIIILNLSIYLVALMLSMLIKTKHSLEVYSFIMSACGFLYITLNFIEAIESFEKSKNMVIMLFFFVWGTGHLCADYLALHLVTSQLFVATTLNIMAIGLIIAITALFSNDLYKYVSTNDNVNFKNLIENIELQAISGFVVSYTVASLYWNYEVIANIGNFAIKDSELQVEQLVTGFLGACIPINIMVIYINKYLLNLIFGILLFFAIIAIPLVANNEISNMAVLNIIGACLCIIASCNILTLTDKFEDKHLESSLQIYFLMSAIGAFTGIAYGDSLIESLGETGFIAALCFVIGAFLAYYIYQFFNRRLYIF